MRGFNWFAAFRWMNKLKHEVNLLNRKTLSRVNYGFKVIKHFYDGKWVNEWNPVQEIVESSETEYLIENCKDQSGTNITLLLLVLVLMLTCKPWNSCHIWTPASAHAKQTQRKQSSQMLDSFQPLTTCFARSHKPFRIFAINQCDCLIKVSTLCLHFKAFCCLIYCLSKLKGFDLNLFPSYYLVRDSKGLIIWILRASSI